MNLVVNARDAMPDGGTVRVETRVVRLREPLRRDNAVVPQGNYVTIRVRDEGHGIPPDKLGRIFEPFFTTKKVGEGTGLGLSMAYGIVKQTGGYIFVDSVVGAGTTFTIYIPAHDAPAEPALAPPSDRAQGTVAGMASHRDRGAPGSAGGTSASAPEPVGAARSGPVTQARRGRHPQGPGEAEQAGASPLTVPDDGAGTGLPSPSPAVADPGGAATALRPAEGTSGPDRKDRTSGEAGGGDRLEGGTGVVLLVEDEAPVRAFAARALKLRGHTVIEAESAEAALAALRDADRHVDLFVTDVVMPGMDGPSWVREALRDRPDVKVIFVSGYSEDDIAEMSQGIPGAVFLPKPFTLADLASTVARQLH
jgi:two-component system cell cycle sensor histidine kinase/response regulator CckA